MSVAFLNWALGYYYIRDDYKKFKRLFFLNKMVSSSLSRGIGKEMETFRGLLLQPVSFMGFYDAANTQKTEAAA
jgi:hypothetical protein